MESDNTGSLDQPELGYHRVLSCPGFSCCRLPHRRGKGDFLIAIEQNISTLVEKPRIPP